MNSAVFLGKFSRHPSWTAVSQMVPETKTIHQLHGSVSNTTGGRGAPRACAVPSAAPLWKRPWDPVLELQSHPRRRPSARRHSRAPHVLTRPLLERGPLPAGRQSGGRDLVQPSRSPGAPARSPAGARHCRRPRERSEAERAVPERPAPPPAPSQAPRARAVLARLHFSTLLFTCPRGRPPVLF